MRKGYKEAPESYKNKDKEWDEASLKALGLGHEELDGLTTLYTGEK